MNEPQRGFCPKCAEEHRPWVLFDVEDGKCVIREGRLDNPRRKEWKIALPCTIEARCSWCGTESTAYLTRQ